MKPLKIGKMDRRITLERFTEIGRDGFNEPIMDWAPLATVWASWRPASARERLASAEVGAETTDVFEGHWSDVMETVNPKDRVIYRGRVYDITRAHEIGRRDGFHIEATTRAD
jgi:SPP1 family predicted phage head-tail adaptor